MTATSALRKSESASADELVARARPFIKWPGGKAQLCNALRALLPAGVDAMRHVEPFMGGSALFFARAPKRALLCDINRDLVETYRAVREEVEQVLLHLRELARNHSEAAYYYARYRYNARDHASRAERAALFVYLNKTCFNGLYRVNKSGHFNVPLGRYAKPAIADEVTLRAASAQLAGVDIRHAPFESLLTATRPGDFVYFDPPYVPSSATASFAAYTSAGFERADQVRLRDVFRALDRRGAKLMLSNSDTPSIHELYRGYRVDIVHARRSVNCQGGRRGAVRELVIRNYETDPS